MTLPLLKNHQYPPDAPWGPGGRRPRRRRPHRGGRRPGRRWHQRPPPQRCQGDHGAEGHSRLSDWRVLVTGRLPRDELHRRCAGRRFAKSWANSGAIDKGIIWSTVVAPFFPHKWQTSEVDKTISRNCLHLYPERPCDFIMLRLRSSEQSGEVGGDLEADSGATAATAHILKTL